MPPVAAGQRGASLRTSFLRHFYVSKPIGRSIWVQPAIGRDAINDDRGVPKNTEETIREGVDVEHEVAKGAYLIRGSAPPDREPFPHR
jgi:hypothetical protein